MRTIILASIFFCTLSLHCQDEAYSNETRDNIFDSGSNYYSISYGTDFENRIRLTAQVKRIVARNLSAGMNFIYSRDRNKLNNWGAGYGLQNYFLNGNTRPFAEIQANLKARNSGNSENFVWDISAEGAINIGISQFISITGGYFTIEAFANYFHPIFTDLSLESGLIPTIRVGFVY